MDEVASFWSSQESLAANEEEIDEAAKAVIHSMKFLSFVVND